MAQDAVAPAAIEIRVDRLGQLFDTLDPLPLTQRDLSSTTEEFIVGWARELPRGQPLRIVLHLTEAGAGTAGRNEVVEAFHNYFRSRADRVTRDLRELFRLGRISLVIGLGVLATCIVIGQMLTPFASDYIAQVSKEGLIILGWVANWRPLEIFLYDWWPLLRQRTLYRRLAVADVVVEEKPSPN